MCRAAQAGVKGSDNSFNPIEHPFGQFVAVDITARNLQNTPIHCQVVMSSGHVQVAPGHPSLLIYFVMVDQGTARRFGDADTLFNVGGSMGPHALARSAWTARVFPSSFSICSRAFKHSIRRA